MKTPLDEIVELLSLELLNADTFRGRPADPGWGQLYGGHVYAQALAAAQRTVSPERGVHVHTGSFLRTGDVNAPITYVVERCRDGASFSNRRVTAYQHEKVIFHATCDFQVAEPGLEHQDPLPEVPPPEAVMNELAMFKALEPRLSEARKAVLARVPGPAFDLRPFPLLDDPDHPSTHTARRDVWLKAMGELPDDPALHACLLAFVSDYYLFSTALLPHGESWLSPRVHIATLNHTLWFHEALRLDAWLLHTMHAPRASHARGLVQGAFYTREGLLVATSTQEGLMRQRKRP